MKVFINRILNIRNQKGHRVHRIQFIGVSIELV